MNTKVKVTVIAALIAITAMALTPIITGYKVKPIKIGVIAATQDGYEDYLPLFKEILEPDINQYVSTLPKLRFNPAREFEFIVEHADSSPAIHLEKVQALHAMGVDLIIGGFWSSQAGASLDYVNEHGILLLSGSSTSQDLSISGDNLYRLCPDDDIQAKPLARMMYSKGTRNAIVRARYDYWSQSLSSAFQDRFKALGGEILGTFYYPWDETDFAPYLEAADNLADGQPDVSVLLQDYVLVRLYTDGQGAVYDRNREFQESRFGTVALPLYVTMSSEDEQIASFPGLTRKPEEFVRFLKDGLNKSGV